MLDSIGNDFLPLHVFCDDVGGVVFVSENSEELDTVWMSQITA